jgi:outer membrane protein assembly factor BamE (lipoprotein component of BamABCDE complex)
MNKNKIMLMVATLFVACNAMAQKLTADAVTIAQGEKASLVVNYEATEGLTGAQFNITLPAGVELEFDDAETFDYVYSTTQKGYNVNIKDQNGYNTVIISRKSNKVGALTSGTELITLSLAAKADAALGAAVAKISGIKFAQTGVSVAGNEDFEVAITVTEATGINSIEANAQDAPAYNLAGQKVNKGFKGLVIMNGKKVVK